MRYDVIHRELNTDPQPKQGLTHPQMCQVPMLSSKLSKAFLLNSFKIKLQLYNNCYRQNNNYICILNLS